MVSLKSFGLAPLISSSLDIGQFCSARSDSLSLREVRHTERGYFNFWGLLLEGIPQTTTWIPLFMKEFWAWLRKWSDSVTTVIKNLYPYYPSYLRLFFFKAKGWLGFALHLEYSLILRRDLEQSWKESFGSFLLGNAGIFVKGLLTFIETVLYENSLRSQGSQIWLNLFPYLVAA